MRAACHPILYIYTCNVSVPYYGLNLAIVSDTSNTNLRLAGGCLFLLCSPVLGMFAPALAAQDSLSAVYADMHDGDKKADHEPQQAGLLLRNLN